MSRCRFLVDECVPSSLARGLRRRVPAVSVLQVGDPESPRKGASDSDLLEFCERHLGISHAYPLLGFHILLASLGQCLRNITHPKSASGC